MRKSVIVAAALGSLFISGSAFATGGPVTAVHQGDENTDSQDIGIIAAIHAKKDTITLADGKTYHLPGVLSAKDYKKGEMVQVSYTTDASGNVIRVAGVKTL
jgi:hypothetical protein